MARSDQERSHPAEPRPVELRFTIGAYSPATMPMARLARYLDNLATVLGETNSVHLVSVQNGSTVPVVVVDSEAYPKVRKRTDALRNGEGPAQALEARKAIEEDLSADHVGYADLVDEDGARLLRFAGEVRTDEPRYGPFSEPGTLDGVPIVVGGRDEVVPVHLQSHDRVHNCLAKRDLAKEIGKHLFTTPLRVSGVGRWLRDREGTWKMRSFRIQDFEELPSESLADATERLRSIDAGWKQRPDPLGDLVALRKLEG